MKRMRRIMHASHFSTASRPAFRNAIELAKSTRTRLLIVHALPPAISPLMGEGVYVSPATWNEIEKGARRAAQRRIARLVQDARRAEVRAEALIVASPPADRIVRAARARHVDLLVLGTVQY